MRLLKRIIGRLPVLNRLAYRALTDLRIARARAFMKENYLYPVDIEQVLVDYRYSIAKNNRGILQVLNIEEAIRSVVAGNIQGAFVEAGTWTGGASAYALRALRRNEPNCTRGYWGFDSFEGMPKPSGLDGNYAIEWMYGKKASAVAAEQVSGALVGSDVNLADYDACLAYLNGTGYPPEQIHLVKGWFQNTLPPVRDKIGAIAILRIDGDFYESTKTVLENLYGNVSPGGFVLIDDYGVFPGCKRAVDEFLSSQGVSPYIHYVDHSIRFFVKPH